MSHIAPTTAPTTPTTDAAYEIESLTAEQAAVLRSRGGAVYIADTKPGFPCRRCLRDAEIGERLILVSHDPFSGSSPYRSASPIFLHVDDCAPTSTVPAPPEQMTVRQLSVRAFDADEMMIDATVIDGADLDATLRSLFDDEAADRIHIHFAQRGCFAGVARRVELVD